MVVVWNIYVLFSTLTWGNDAIWLMFFRWVGSTTNIMRSCVAYISSKPPSITQCYQGHFLPIRVDIPPRCETSKDWVKLGCCGPIDMYGKPKKQPFVYGWFSGETRKSWNDSESSSWKQPLNTLWMFFRYQVGAFPKVHLNDSLPKSL